MKYKQEQAHARIFDISARKVRGMRASLQVPPIDGPAGGVFGWRSQPAILRILEAHDRTMRAAEIIRCRENALSRIRKLAAKNSDGGRILAAILRQDPGGMR
jgi:hypothetical protein